jgi:hypothetical protein
MYLRVLDQVYTKSLNHVVCVLFLTFPYIQYPTPIIMAKIITRHYSLYLSYHNSNSLFSEHLSCIYIPSDYSASHDSVSQSVWF